MSHQTFNIKYHGENYKLSIHRGLPYVGLENLDDDTSIFFQESGVYEAIPNFDELDEKDIFSELLNYLY